MSRKENILVPAIGLVAFGGVLAGIILLLVNLEDHRNEINNVGKERFSISYKDSYNLMILTEKETGREWLDTGHGVVEITKQK